jgi:hypothetical protein
VAAIIEFWKPLGGGAYHAFLLLQNDAGEFVEIARGGPESAIDGPLGLNSGGYDVVEWVRFAHESELFDVAAIPLTCCPTAIAPEGSDMQDAITFEEMTSSGGNASGALASGDGRTEGHADPSPQEMRRHALRAR